MEERYVWYVSYGSNLNRERFSCYIEGGQPPDSAKAEIGCRNPAVPEDDQPIILPYQMYFSGRSKRWGGGRAFIAHEKNDAYRTLGRMYLITEEQFIDVVKQENNQDELHFELEEVKREGAKVLNASHNYGRIVYAGEKRGSPIFTFTSPQDITEREAAAPSSGYLTTIITGILQKYDADVQDIVNYFYEKPGVRLGWTKQQLSRLKVFEGVHT